MPVTGNQVYRVIRNLTLFKAPGPNGVSNVVFVKCTDQLVPWMGHLF